MSLSKGPFFLILSLSVACVILGVAWSQKGKGEQKPLPQGWSIDEPIPEGRPIVGIWTLDRVDVQFVIRRGLVYFEYAPKLPPTFCGAPIYNSPPDWWIDGPGAAR